MKEDKLKKRCTLQYLERERERGGGGGGSKERGSDLHVAVLTLAGCCSLP